MKTVKTPLGFEAAILWEHEGETGCVLLEPPSQRGTFETHRINTLKVLRLEEPTLPPLSSLDQETLDTLIEKIRTGRREALAKPPKKTRKPKPAAIEAPKKESTEVMLARFSMKDLDEVRRVLEEHGDLKKKEEGE